MNNIIPKMGISQEYTYIAGTGKHAFLKQRGLRPHI